MSGPTRRDRRREPLLIGRGNTTGAASLAGKKVLAGRKGREGEGGRVTGRALRRGGRDLLPVSPWPLQTGLGGCGGLPASTEP